MKDEDKIVCEKTHTSAEQYNLMIWTIFSVGIAVSLYILNINFRHKTELGAMQFFTSILGFFILVYSILAIESFNQKKSLLYKIYHCGIKKNSLEPKIKELPFYRLDWLAEIILFSVLLAYDYLFWFIWINNSLEKYGEKIMALDLPMFVFSLVLAAIVVSNWITRPKDDGGNFIEKIRAIIFENYLKNYDEIAKRIQREKPNK